MNKKIAQILFSILFLSLISFFISVAFVDIDLDFISHDKLTEVDVGMLFGLILGSILYYLGNVAGFTKLTV